MTPTKMVPEKMSRSCHPPTDDNVSVRVHRGIAEIERNVWEVRVGISDYIPAAYYLRTVHKCQIPSLTWLTVPRDLYTPD